MKNPQVQRFLLLSIFITIGSLFTISPAQGKDSPHPLQFIKDFPIIKWGMTFDETKSAISKTGAYPVSIIKTEIAWDGKFGDKFGRATVLLNEEGRVNQISLVLYGMDKLEELYKNWSDNFTKKYGKTNQKSENKYSVSLVWKLKDKISVELRKIKDPDSPVININWVKE